MTASALMLLTCHIFSSVSTALTGLAHARGLAWDSLSHKRKWRASVAVLLPRVRRARAVRSVSGCLWRSVLFDFWCCVALKELSPNPLIAMYTIHCY